MGANYQKYAPGLYETSFTEAALHKFKYDRWMHNCLMQLSMNAIMYSRVASQVVGSQQLASNKLVCQFGEDIAITC